ncbi:Helix-turn-helix, AraC domain-containing protein (plasmid) [Gemmatirosa kalamazoonensis]|uniref:Helix-turn-helix, AraC domain-containing protein n=1 Tax=Gemmatirosa kalamazoonensis TaxID=861299 RepID=W0RT55_9BACT|nr:AraC family transcriptional regulator [Gemmatirosa kalamazoonensis]AHG93871.1 Helix-turn-helix, AraC domain-containing protein [Gemmatirosa kalamazoonensis]
MRSILEHVEPDPNSSFRLLTPHLPDVFLWHYHPEYEVVYIEGASGTRHVGDHISRYEGSDLVFIGPNVPHLNFDYGVTTAYRKVVVQLKPDFLGATAWDAPELAPIAALFERARSGLSFHGATKAAVGRQLTRLPALPPFQRLLLLLRIFERLASSDEATPLRAECAADAYDPQEQRRMRALGRFVADEYGRKIQLREAAAVVNLTDAAFCRFFKRMTRLTFTQFVNRYRVHQAQRLLLTGHSVTQAALACGFESVSYFNKVFRRVTGENPLRFRQRHRRGEHAVGRSIR